jgi:hypothetical protein
MPCYRCGTRQVDPPRGPSPWKRGVKAGTQVLICPECQAFPTWAADLDACPACGSTVLVRMLGATVCRMCGRSTDDAVPEEPAAPPPAEGLAAEVDAALGRVLGKPPVG